MFLIHSVLCSAIFICCSSFLNFVYNYVIHVCYVFMTTILMAWNWHCKFRLISGDTVKLWLSLGLVLVLVWLTFGKVHLGQSWAVSPCGICGPNSNRNSARSNLERATGLTAVSQTSLFLFHIDKTPNILNL